MTHGCLIHIYAHHFEASVCFCAPPALKAASMWRRRIYTVLTNTFRAPWVTENRARDRTRLTDSAHGGEERMWKRGGSRDGSNRKKGRIEDEQYVNAEESDRLHALSGNGGFRVIWIRRAARRDGAVFLGVQAVDAHGCDSVWDLAPKEERREVGRGFPPWRCRAAAETAA